MANNFEAQRDVGRSSARPMSGELWAHCTVNWRRGSGSGAFIAVRQGDEPEEIGRSPQFRWPKSSATPPDLPEVVVCLAELEKELVDEGWERVDNGRGSWYAPEFRRAVVPLRNRIGAYTVEADQLSLAWLSRAPGEPATTAGKAGEPSATASDHPESTPPETRYSRPSSSRQESRDSEQRLQAELAADRVEAARVEAARVEAARVEAARVEAARVEAARVEAARVEAARVEAERLEAERVEAERVEAERLQAERLKAERVEAERLEAERLAGERAEAERIEAERLEAVQVEAERLLSERLEAERIEAGRQEAERLEAERVEAQRLRNERRKEATVNEAQEREKRTPHQGSMAVEEPWPVPSPTSTRSTVHGIDASLDHRISPYSVSSAPLVEMPSLEIRIFFERKRVPRRVYRVQDVSRRATRSNS